MSTVWIKEKILKLNVKEICNKIQSIVDKTEIEELEITPTYINYVKAPPNIKPTGNGPIQGLKYWIKELGKYGWINNIYVKGPGWTGTFKLEIPLYGNLYSSTKEKWNERNKINNY